MAGTQVPGTKLEVDTSARDPAEILKRFTQSVTDRFVGELNAPGDLEAEEGSVVSKREFAQIVAPGQDQIESAFGRKAKEAFDKLMDEAEHEAENA